MLLNISDSLVDTDGRFILLRECEIVLEKKRESYSVFKSDLHVCVTIFMDLVQNRQAMSLNIVTLHHSCSAIIIIIYM